MHRFAVVVLLASCSPSGVGASKEASSPAEASPAEPRTATPSAPRGDSEGAAAAVVAPPTDDTGDAETPEPEARRLGAAEPPPLTALCEQRCFDSMMMRAVAAEVLEAECRERCEGFSAKAPDEACAAEAKRRRAELERVPMEDRALRFWGLLSDPALSCGVSDPVLEGLSDASRHADPSRRTLAMRAQILRDPWIELTCPAGTEALDKPALQSSVDAVVRLCPIADAEPGQPIYDDIDVVTFLAVEVVRTHWKAAGATSSDHEIMLNTVLLSTALAHE